MKRYLALALHFHQPVGNFDSVIERAYSNSYLPFIKTILKYPNIKVNLHFSGSLLKWIELNHSEFFELLFTLVKRNQVELLTGGFYEPILTAIPERDAIGQIQMLSDYLNNKFSVNPTGIWLAERVWEPYLPRILNKVNINYTVLDDIHIYRSGVVGEYVRGYYITEDESRKVSIFPNDKNLRYLIPFSKIDDVISYIEKSGFLLTYGDDGEKFGEWPGTYDLVYKKRWLELFFERLLSRREHIETVKFSEYMDENKPECAVYIPQSSYEEMMYWSMDNENQKFLERIRNEFDEKKNLIKYINVMAGGFWKNFFIKYPESNQMHKKLIHTSRRAECIGIEYNKSNNKEKKQILKSLYKAGCNCAYWHGLFGGLYLHHIRNAVYKNLIEANRDLNNLLHNEQKWIETEVGDFDCDGSDEIIISNPEISIWINPAEGGSIVEIDWMKKGINILNILTRKREPYHEELTSSEQLKKEKIKGKKSDKENYEDDTLDVFYFDRLRRASFTDYFFESNIKSEDLIKGSVHTLQLTEKRNQYKYFIEKGNDSVDIILDGQLNNQLSPPHVKKKYTIKNDKGLIGFSFEIKNIPENYRNNKFATEINFSLPSADSEGNRIYFNSFEKGEHRLNRIVEGDSVGGCEIKSPYDSATIKIMLSPLSRVLSFPVKTVSRSERGFDFNYQGTCLFFIWDISGKENFEVSGEIRLIKD